jgi:type II secretion system protein I
MNSHWRARRRQLRRGFTLLEVILALAIFAGSLAVVGELVRLGARNARDTRDLTQAQLLCESTMAEVAAGMIPAQAVGPTPCESNPDWSYSLDVEATNAASLLSVRVTLAPTAASTRPGVQFSLVRWLVDPEQVAAAQQEADEQAEAAAAAKSSSSSSSSSGSSGSPSSAAGS